MLFRFVYITVIILGWIVNSFGQSIRIPPLLQVEIAREPLAFEPGNKKLKDQRSRDYILIGVEMEANGDWKGIEQIGGAINTRIEDRATVHLPKSAVYPLLELRGMKAIHYNPPLYPHDERAIEHVHADKVHDGVKPLLRGYTGKNVIVGIIDTGIDYKHPDFRDPKDPTRSRIAFIWDQLVEKGKQPTGFSYGAEWDREQVSRELGANPPRLVSHLDTLFEGSGHGTHVSGTAAGNSGVAYEADIIVVASNYSEAGIIDAANYIKRKAAELKKPCVINLSLGSNLHAHDGTDFLSESLSALIDRTEGLVLVASAGNDGEDPLHWGGFELSSEPSSVYFFGVTGLWTFFRIPKTYASSVEMAITVDSARYNPNTRKLTAQKEIGKTDWIKLNQIGNTPITQVFQYPQGQTAVTLSIYNLTSSTKNYAEFVVFLDEATNRYTWRKYVDELELFRFSLRGKGSFDAWFSSLEAITYNRPEEAGAPVMNYRPANTDLSVSSPGDGRNIITVGAYTNRSSWWNINNQSVYFQPPQEEGELASFSSYGPTFDGRIKPEIIAPGKAVVSAFPSYNEINSALLTGSNPKWASLAGTSMAAPIVTGSIALLLEQNPKMNFDAVRKVLTATAQIDDQTRSEGPLPNGHWGYGKLNIFEAMLASRQAVPGEPALLIVSPNPAHESVNVRFFAGGSEQGQIQIYDLTGRLVSQPQTINRGENVEFHVHQLPAGLYILEWTDGQSRVTRKLVIN